MRGRCSSYSFELILTCIRWSSFTARFVLVNLFISPFTAEQNASFFSERLSLIRRVLFSRSLRLMPLPQQVGVVEGLAVIIKEVPGLLPLSDQHLLAFLSELLKMSSVADGEMSDKTLTNCVVDKNGYVASKIDANAEVYPSHASALFFRRECAVSIHGVKFVVPEELPVGVQLRVASIALLHAVIRGYTNAFFDAESTTPIGK
jgi:transformation/transcription domain-associated protein